MIIGNDNRPPEYWKRNKRMGESTINLTLANQPFENWTILDGIYAMGCDHKIKA